MAEVAGASGPLETSKAGIANAVQKSLKRRYKAESRFKLYGLLAIGFAMLTLVVLFTTIIANGIGAFWQSEVTLEAAFSTEDVDPENIAGGNYRSIAFGALRKEFPNVPRGRRGRPLTELLSTDAPFAMQRAVRDNPAIIGGVQSVDVLLSDDADIFLKGKMTTIGGIDVSGTASVVVNGDEVKILSTANDFAPILAQVKDALRGQAATLERRARQADRSLTVMEGDLEDLNRAVDQAAGDTARLEDLQQRLSSLTNDIASTVSQRDAVLGQAEVLRNRAANPGGPEATDSSISSYLVKIHGGLVKITSVDNADVAGTVIVEMQSDGDARPGAWEIVRLDVPEDSRRLSDAQIGWLMTLEDRGRISQPFNTTLFTAGDSREPEQAGIWGAVVGSFFTLMVTLLLSFPIGVMAAIYLEEFAPKNRLTDIIEVNINNLAAVPSIVFGLLGLAVFLNFFGLPRSAPLVGGLVLTLMTLPTIIIASRAALKSVPPSIREAALGMGASRLQAMTHHVLPLAMPGMLTGTIIGMAQALGETAPLLMIGMVAFIVDIPGGPTDPATVLPVQIFLWADAPERAFVERTSAAIMVLLGFLITMNLTAVLLRKRFEKRW